MLLRHMNGFILKELDKKKINCLDLLYTPHKSIENFYSMVKLISLNIVFFTSFHFYYSFDRQYPISWQRKDSSIASIFIMLFSTNQSATKIHYNKKCIICITPLHLFSKKVPVRKQKSSQSLYEKYWLDNKQQAARQCSP